MEIWTLATVNGMALVATAEVAAISNSSGGKEINPEEGMGTDTLTDAGVKDPLLSSWPFVIGISAGVLAISIVVGVFLAKRKIKKGIDLYED